MRFPSPRRSPNASSFHASHAFRCLGLTLLLALTLAGCAGSPERVAGAASSPGSGGRATSGVEQLRPEVLGTLPHDGQAFTQGLVWDNGVLYESTGLHGRSSLRRVNPATGQVEVLVPLAPRFFGEGLALVGDRLVQITWQEGVALVYDRATLEQVDTFAYTGEGWGLCYDGARLVMSDGSSNLTFRDPHTFETLGSVPVTLRGRPVERLNELECVGDVVYANVWQTDTIVRIDPGSGRVTADIDAAGILPPAERAAADVLNGIAYDPERDVFLITGKLWPRLFEVRFVP